MDAAPGADRHLPDGPERTLPDGTDPQLPLPPGPTRRAWASRFATHRQRHRRPGDLSPGWATALAGGWLLVVIGLGAVWVSSRTTGLSTWWLGPEARPASPLVTGLPFAMPLAVVIGTLTGTRHMARVGIVAAAATAAVALGDLGRVSSYALAEFVLAIGGLLVSLAAIAGTYRGPAATTASGDER